MASTNHPAEHETEVELEQVDEEAYLDRDDVLEELEDDGDAPMDEDDDQLGELPTEGNMEEGEEEETIYEDNSLAHFTGHRGSVFVVAAHPSAHIAVSGGEDDLGYLWDIDSGEQLVKLSGHTDSVTNAAFSADGEMVATGGMDGKVRVWRRVGKENFKSWEFLTELQGPDEVQWLRWHPKGAVLLAGSEDSTVWLWQLPSGNIMQVFAGHTSSVQCGEFTPDGKRIVTADAEGTLAYWDPRSPQPLFKLTPTNPRFHVGGITSLAVNASSTLAIVGGQTGAVRVVSLSKGEVVSALGGHQEGDSVEAVRFIDLAGSGAGPGVAVTGATDGKAHIWDLSTNRLRATLEHKDAVTTLLGHPTNPYLVVSASADKVLRTWDARTGKLLQEHKGHHDTILGAAFGLGGKLVISAGDDGVCLVFPTE